MRLVTINPAFGGSRMRGRFHYFMPLPMSPSFFIVSFFCISPGFAAASFFATGFCIPCGRSSCLPPVIAGFPGPPSFVAWVGFCWPCGFSSWRPCANAVVAKAMVRTKNRVCILLRLIKRSLKFSSITRDQVVVTTSTYRHPWCISDENNAAQFCSNILSRCYG